MNAARCEGQGDILQACFVLLGLAASMPVLLLQEWATLPVKPNVTFQQFMREAQSAGEVIWIAAIAEVSQYQHRCAAFPPDIAGRQAATGCS